MPGRGTDAFKVPDLFWRRPEVVSVLRERDIGKLLALVHDRIGATQTQLATACGMVQPKISALVRGESRVEKLVVFERFADALDMPDAARVHLGLAPHEPRPSGPGGAHRQPFPGIPGGQPDIVSAAAHEASADPLTVVTAVDPQSMEWLVAESLEVARAANRSPLDTLTAAKHVRDQALELGGRTRRPAVLTELYAICGQATALMASGAFDLNRWDESATLAKSAIAYAALAGHDSLQAWTYGLAALLANWRNEPDLALRHFEHGMKVSPPGAPRVRLRYIASRSYALLADSESVADVLAAARRDQDDADHYPDPLSGEIGGEFAFSRARAEACAAAAWLDLGRGTEAVQAAQSALESLTSLPLPPSHVSGQRCPDRHGHGLPAQQ